MASRGDRRIPPSTHVRELKNPKKDAPESLNAQPVEEHAITVPNEEALDMSIFKTNVSFVFKSTKRTTLQTANKPAELKNPINAAPESLNEPAVEDRAITVAKEEASDLSIFKTNGRFVFKPTKRTPLETAKKPAEPLVAVRDRKPDGVGPLFKPRDTVLQAYFRSSSNKPAGGVNRHFLVGKGPANVQDLAREDLVGAFGPKAPPNEVKTEKDAVPESFNAQSVEKRASWVPNHERRDLSIMRPAKWKNGRMVYLTTGVPPNAGYIARSAKKITTNSDEKEAANPIVAVRDRKPDGVGPLARPRDTALQAYFRSSSNKPAGGVKRKLPLGNLPTTGNRNGQEKVLRNN